MKRLLTLSLSLSLLPAFTHALEDKPNILLILADDLDQDPGETNNLYFKHPEVVKELKGLLEESKQSGRSAPAR